MRGSAWWGVSRSAGSSLAVWVSIVSSLAVLGCDTQRDEAANERVGASPTGVVEASATPTAAAPTSGAGVSPERAASEAEISAAVAALRDHAVTPIARPVKLIAAGGDPKRELRYRCRAGARQKLRVSGAISADGPKDERKWLDGETVVVKASDDACEYLVAAVAGERSVSFAFRISPQGEVTALGAAPAGGEASPAAKTGAEASQLMMMAPLRLPADRVGIGAVWEIETPQPEGALVDVLRAELVAATDERLELELSSSQRWAEGASPVPGQLLATGKGTAIVSLTLPLATSTLRAASPGGEFFASTTVKAAPPSPVAPELPPLRDTKDEGVSDEQRQLIKSYLESGG